MSERMDLLMEAERLAHENSDFKQPERKYDPAFATGGMFCAMTVMDRDRFLRIEAAARKVVRARRFVPREQAIRELEAALRLALATEESK